MEAVFYDEIVSIEYIGEIETIDISVSGNNLFFANDILTHNSGISSTDPDVTDVAEAISVLHTADFSVTVTRTEELDAAAQILIKQQKNRFGNKADKPRFILGVDIDRQILHSVNNAEQTDLITERSQIKLNTDSKNLKDKFKRMND